MRRIGLATLILIGIGNFALADFLTYSQWLNLPPIERDRYVAGMLDGFWAPYFGTEYARKQNHFSACVVRTEMTDGQISENVKAFVATRPKLQAGSLWWGLFSYLEELCGPPPR